MTARVPSRYTLATVMDWSYGGVNSSIPGNGGPECAGFISFERKLLETIAACCLSLFYTYWGWKFLTLPATLPFLRKDRGGKRLLLVIVSMVFGMEIGFKFASKQLIYLLNPCHVTTAIQIYLLATPPSRFVTVVFRIHLNFLNGAVLAILFPVTNTRIMPFEEELYWVQHTLMLVTPYYLLRLGGVYTIEDLRDYSWTGVSTGLLFMYHFLPLQAIGMLSEVNLNNMLCPAISDPFYGQHYRVAALMHQSLCVPFVAKTFCAIATFFITTCPFTKVKDDLGTDVTMSSYRSHYKKSCGTESGDAAHWWYTEDGHSFYLHQHQLTSTANTAAKGTYCCSCCSDTEYQHDSNGGCSAGSSENVSTSSVPSSSVRRRLNVDHDPGADSVSCSTTASAICTITPESDSNDDIDNNQHTGSNGYTVNERNNINHDDLNSQAAKGIRGDCEKHARSICSDIVNGNGQDNSACSVCDAHEISNTSNLLLYTENDEVIFHTSHITDGDGNITQFDHICREVKVESNETLQESNTLDLKCHNVTKESKNVDQVASHQHLE